MKNANNENTKHKKSNFNKTISLAHLFIFTLLTGVTSLTHATQGNGTDPGQCVTFFNWSISSPENPQSFLPQSTVISLACPPNTTGVKQCHCAKLIDSNGTQTIALGTIRCQATGAIAYLNGSPVPNTLLSFAFTPGTISNLRCSSFWMPTNPPNPEE